MDKPHLLALIVATLAHDLDVLTRTVVAQAPKLQDQNMAAVHAGWQAAGAQLQAVAP